MVKAWCIWCETGNKISSSGYFWIHDNCSHELMNIKSDLKTIIEILNGKHRRNELQPKKDKVDLVLEFIKDMEDHKRRWEGTMKLMKDLGFMRNVKEPSKKFKED